MLPSPTFHEVFSVSSTCTEFGHMNRGGSHLQGNGILGGQTYQVPQITVTPHLFLIQMY